MKQISKKISKFLLLGSIFVTLSCEVQEKYNESNTSQKIIVEDFSLQSIQGKTNSKLLEVANKVKSLKTKVSNSKIVYNADFDFYMEDEHGKHVVVDGKDSYTFEITRPTGDNKVENIVFNEKTDGGFDTYFVKYDFTKDEFKTLPTQVLKEKNRVFSQLDTQTNRVNVICVVEMVWVSGQSQWGQEQNPGGGTPGYWGVGSVDCSAIYDSGSLGGSSGGNAGGTNSNPVGNNGNPSQTGTGGINTSPVVVPPTINPCVKLSAKTNDALFKSKVALLNNSSSFSNQHETGFSEGKDPVTGIMGYTNQVGIGASNTLPSLPNSIGQVHVHNHDFPLFDANGDLTPYVPVPGYGDLIAFVRAYQTNAIIQDLSSQDTYQLTIQPESEGSFAFMSLVDNLSVDDGSIDFEELKKDYFKRANKLSKDGNLNNTTARKMLLNLMKDNGLYDKVGLYLATNPEKTQWSRLTLDRNGGIVPIPCN